jgi:hypothetical protein
MARLEAIEQDLAHRQNKLDTYAEGFYDAKRGVELALAKARIGAEGTEQTRKDKALVEVSATPEYETWSVAEAKYHGVLRAVQTLESRASILQSLLKVKA